MHSLSTAALLITTFALSTSLGVEKPAATKKKQEVAVVRLSIAPAKENVPALKYQLLPKFIDRKPGNAAVGYGKAVMAYKSGGEMETRLDEAFKLAPADYERYSREHDLKQYSTTAVYDELKIAARRTYCDWDLPIHEQMVFTILLPEQQELRKLARLAALEARESAAGGKFDDAVAALQVGYAIARHNAQSPTLINGLVGLSIAGMMDHTVLHLAQRPGSPSLYAALLFQPRPLVDSRPGIEGEMYSVEMTFPEFREALVLGPAERDWNAVVGRVINKWSQSIALMQGTGAVDNELLKSLHAGLILTRVAVRRREMQAFLIERGIEKAHVESMGDAQLLLAHAGALCDELRDDIFRWMPLPYPEANRRMLAAEERLKRSIATKEENLTIAGLLLPAIRTVRWTYARAERRHDVLLLVEALRIHAAANEGRLPKSIDELQAATPTSLVDCISGKPWDYHLVGEQATLTLVGEKQSDLSDTLRYEFSVADGKK